MKHLARLAAAPVLLATQLAQPALAAPFGDGFCSPGSATESAACVSQGQTGKGMASWKAGDTVKPGQISEWISRPSQYILPPLAPGEGYVMVSGQILKVDDRTDKVIAGYQPIKWQLN